MSPASAATSAGKGSGFEAQVWPPSAVRSRSNVVVPLPAGPLDTSHPSFAFAYQAARISLAPAIGGASRRHSWPAVSVQYRSLPIKTQPDPGETSWKARSPAEAGRTKGTTGLALGEAPSP